MNAILDVNRHILQISGIFSFAFRKELIKRFFDDRHQAVATDDSKLFNISISSSNGTSKNRQNSLQNGNRYNLLLHTFPRLEKSKRNIDYVKNRSVKLIPVVYEKKRNSKNCAREGVNSTKTRERKRAFSEMVFRVVIKGRDSVKNLKFVIKGRDSVKNLKFVIKGRDSVKNLKFVIKGRDSVKNLKFVIKGRDSVKNLKFVIKGRDSVKNLKVMIKGRDSMKSSRLVSHIGTMNVGRLIVL